MWPEGEPDSQILNSASYPQYNNLGQFSSWMLQLQNPDIYVTSHKLQNKDLPVQVFLSWYQFQCLNSGHLPGSAVALKTESITGYSVVQYLDLGQNP